MAIKAFSLFGEIQIKGDQIVVRNLKNVSRQVDVTKRDLGSLKGNFGFSGGTLSNLNSALGTLSNISNVIQGIPVVGKLIEGALYFATGPVKDMAQLGLGFNDLKENATLAFGVILKDGAKAKKLFEDLAKFGMASPIFKNADMIRYSQQLLPFTGPGSDLFEALKGIGAMTAVTGDLSRMGDIFLAMTQIARKPKLSSEEMNQQLSEAGVDAWGLLARGLGRTTGEVQEMAGAGRLSGIGSFKVMVQQALREYESLVDLMGQTRTGKQAQIDDTMEQLAARGTQNLHGAWKGAQDRLLQNLQGPKGGQLADQVNDFTGFYGEKILGAFDSLTDGSLLSKAQAATQNIVNTVQGTIQGAGESAKSTMKGYADSLYQGFTEFWEINSPSERARRLGQWIKEGLELGLNKGQAQNYARMKWASEQDPNFIRSIVAGASKRGINPDDMLNLIAIESGFNKAVINPWGYGGLGQVGPNERASMGLPRNAAEFKKLLQSKSESWQVENVLFPFLDMKLRSNPGVREDGISLSELYAMWGSGHATGNPLAVHMARGGKRSTAYANNPLWDVNKDGVVRESEFGPAAMGALGAGKFFSVNGAPISGANPIPVKVTDGPALGGKLPEKEKLTGEKMLSDFNAAMATAKSIQTSQEAMRQGMLKNGKSPEEVEKLMAATEKGAKVTEEKAIPGLEKLGETAKLTAEQIEANRKLAETEGKAAKQKRDPLFDTAFTREGVAGDFHSELSYLLGNMGWEKSGQLGKQALFGLIHDIQGRLANDFSSMITEGLFGHRGEEGKLTGGLFGGKSFSLGGIFSKIFGGLFGGFRASGGGMSPGRFYIAGERGPEIVEGPGYVHNARATRAMLSDGGGDTHVTLALGDRAMGEMYENYYSSRRGMRRMIRVNARYGRAVHV